MAEQHVLLKFFGEKKYAQSFLDGKLYMNTLHYFWNEYRIEAAKRQKEKYISERPEVDPDSIFVEMDNKLSREQEDILEGAVSTANCQIEGLTDSNIVYRAVGYQYCNVCCFYRMDLTSEILDSGYSTFQYELPYMNTFGNSVVIIEDKEELIRRIHKAAEEQGLKYVCGNVKYKDPQTNVDLTKQYSFLAESSEVVDLSGKNATIARDCFMKAQRYSDQKEWRIALYRGVKKTEAFIFDIGSIRDIARIVKKDYLTEEIDDLLGKKKIVFGSDLYGGNVSRKELRSLFLKLGDEKAQEFLTLAYEETNAK